MIHCFVNWNISPEIIEIGSFSIRYYGLLFALGFILGYFIVKKIIIYENIPVKELDNITMYVFIGAIVGARLGHVLFYEATYYFEHPIEIIKVWHGGLASHGGAVGILISLYIYSRKSKFSYLWLLDIISIPTALAGVFIRIGNLMNSEIYGHQTSLPWGFIFVRNNENVAKHPTQIYEALSYFFIFLLLKKVYNHNKNSKKNGLLIGIFLVFVFGIRFLIEFIKEDQVDFEQSLPLNMGQFLSLPLIISGIILCFYAMKSKKLLTK